MYVIKGKCVSAVRRRVRWFSCKEVVNGIVGTGEAGLEA